MDVDIDARVQGRFQVGLPPGAQGIDGAAQQFFDEGASESVAPSIPRRSGASAPRRRGLPAWAGWAAAAGIGFAAWFGWFGPGTGEVDPADLRREVMARATVRERNLFGFPKPGDPYWNEQTLADVGARYPAMDMTPYREAAR